MRGRPIDAALLVGAAVLASGCGHEIRRFPLRDPVWIDDDLRPVVVPCRPDPENPKRKICRPEEYFSPLYGDAADKLVLRPIASFLSADMGGEARNVNALDEIPDSSWFTNRIGTRAMTPAEVELGSCAGKTIRDAPRTDGSWLVDMGKPAGINAGFRVSIEGVGKFMLKVDEAKVGERVTAAAAITTRIYHAAGYWVPCNMVAYVDPRWLKLKPGLTYEDYSKGNQPFDQPALDGILARAQKRDGLLRLGVSRWLPGRVVGPFKYDGVRDDDPNDLIPHQDRRDLRGVRLLAAWIGHWDTREENTRTTWMSVDSEDKDASPGHTLHWQLDLDESFGAILPFHALETRLNHSYFFDAGDIALDFVTLGIITRPWDRPRRNQHPLFDTFTPEFDPETWKASYPNPAFMRMTERDGAWAARIIARFSKEDLTAAVSVGDLDDSTASTALVATLVARRGAILRRYFKNLSPLADPVVRGSSICFTDLARSTDTFAAKQFRYAASLRTGPTLETRRALDVAVEGGGRMCVTLPRATTGASPDDSPERYAVLDVTNAAAPGPLRVHFYDLGAERGYRMVAIQRPEDIDDDL